MAHRPRVPVTRNTEEQPTATEPVDFTAYELDATWQGPRWLATCQGHDNGTNVWFRSVSIGHGSRSGDERVAVTTLLRERFDRAVADKFDDPLEAVAHEAVTSLMNHMSESSEPRASMSGAQLSATVDRVARDHAAWSPTSWDVDGRPLPAVVSECLSGWVGISNGLSDVYLAVAATDARPAGLSLTRLTDVIPYRITRSTPYQLLFDTAG